MVAGQVSFKYDRGSSVEKPSPVNFKHVLIPVSFSDLSDIAFAYALKLVKAVNGVIDLFHIINLDDVAESDNPFVVKRWLMKREKESASRIQFSEIIDESHVSVSSTVVVIGHKGACMLKQIQERCRNLIVLGKSSKADNLASFISENSTCQVLIVPFSPTLGIPAKVALAADQNPVTQTSLSSFFRIVQHTTQSFSLLRTQQEKGGGCEKNQEIYVNGHDLRISHVESESIISYVTRNEVDLLCTIRRKQDFFTRLFRKRRAWGMIEHFRHPGSDSKTSISIVTNRVLISFGRVSALMGNKTQGLSLVF